jgi:capsular polysaccharide transport system permease protein
MLTDLGALDKQKLGPNAPAREVMQSRIKAVREQLAAVEAEVASVRDGSNPLSKVVSDYERLDLERQFAQTMVLSARQYLEQAKSAALAQALYITPFVRPAVPDSSTYPKRIAAVAIAFVVFVILWLVGLLLVRSMREHLA